MTLKLTGSGGDFAIALLLPKGKHVQSAMLDGREVDATAKHVEDSEYALFHVQQSGAHSLEVRLQ